MKRRQSPKQNLGRFSSRMSAKGLLRVDWNKFYAEEKTSLPEKFLDEKFGEKDEKKFAAWAVQVINHFRHSKSVKLPNGFRVRKTLYGKLSGFRYFVLNQLREDLIKMEASKQINKVSMSNIHRYLDIETRSLYWEREVLTEQMVDMEYGTVLELWNTDGDLLAEHLKSRTMLKKSLAVVVHELRVSKGGLGKAIEHVCDEMQKRGVKMSQSSLAQSYHKFQRELRNQRPSENKLVNES